MPRFFFHSADGSLDIDADGVDLPDASTAQIEAARLAGSLLRDEPVKVWEAGSWHVEVTDEEGALLFTIITMAVDAALRKPKRTANDKL